MVIIVLHDDPHCMLKLLGWKFVLTLSDIACLCLQLFSKGSKEADGADRRALKPAAIKYDVRLGGFAAACKLSSRGYVLQPSPYRSAHSFQAPIL